MFIYTSAFFVYILRQKYIQCPVMPTNKAVQYFNEEMLDSITPAAW